MFRFAERLYINKIIVSCSWATKTTTTWSSFWILVFWIL